MKIKLKSAWHRKTFTEFIAANVHALNEYAQQGYSVTAKRKQIASALLRVE